MGSNLYMFNQIFCFQDLFMDMILTNERFCKQLKLFEEQVKGANEVRKRVRSVFQLITNRIYCQESVVPTTS